MKIRIHRSGTTYGPYEGEVVERFLEENRVSLHDWAWVPGMDDWQRLEEVLGDEEEVQLDGENLSDNVAKIRRLIQKERGEHAMDLVLALDNPKLYGALLEGCSISQDGWSDGRVELHPEIDSPDGLALFLLCVSRIPPDSPSPSISRSKKLSINLELEDDALKPLGSFDHLETLELTEAVEPKSFDFLAHMPRLRELTLQNLRHCKDLNFLEQFPRLEKLVLGNYQGTSLEPVARMKGLTHLTLDNFPNLPDLPPLASVNSLENLYLDECPLLKKVDSLRGATRLKFLSLRSCEQLEDLQGLSESPVLESVSLHYCESLHDIGPLEALAESIDLSLYDCPALKKILVRLLGVARVAKAVMEWNGSGDDGYSEGVLLNAEGEAVSPPNEDSLKDMMDNLLMARLPGGAEINSGSEGTLTLDLLKGTGNWRFYWRDDEREQSSGLIDQVEAEGFDRLTASLRFAFHQHGDSPEDALDEHWNENPVLHALFYEYEQWAYLAEVELVDEGLQDNPSPESSEIDFKYFFTEFVEAESPGRYNGQPLFEKVMNALFEEDLKDDPRILVQAPITLTVDSIHRNLTFRRGEFEYVAEIGTWEPDDDVNFKLE